VISTALKTSLKNKIGNLHSQNFTSASARWLYWFHIKLSPPHFTTKLRPSARAKGESRTTEHTHSRHRHLHLDYDHLVASNTNSTLHVESGQSWMHGKIVPAELLPLMAKYTLPF